MIVIIDNDVLVEIFDIIYHADKDKFKMVLNHLFLRFEQMWIPRTVKIEFCAYGQHKKRERRLQKMLSKYGEWLQICPIVVSKNERELYVNVEKVDEGEADAISQIMKLEKYKDVGKIRLYKGKKFIFLTNDSTASRYASENLGIEVLPFQDLKNELREMGVEI